MGFVPPRPPVPTCAINYKSARLHSHEEENRKYRDGVALSPGDSSVNGAPPAVSVGPERPLLLGELELGLVETRGGSEEAGRRSSRGGGRRGGRGGRRELPHLGSAEDFHLRPALLLHNICDGEGGQLQEL